MEIQARVGDIYIPVTLTPLSSQKIQVTFPYNKELVQEIKSYEGAKWKPEKKVWWIANSYRNKYCLKRLINPRDPHYHDPEPIPEPQFQRTLYQHQKDAVKTILSKQRVILAAEPGVGKTLVAIEVMERIGGYYWIIIPKTARGVWEYELAKWKTKLTLHNFGYPTRGEYNLINMHQLYNATTTCPKDKWPTGLIIDEVHFFKNPQSQRSKTLLLLAEHVRSNGTVILPMTGTPAPKDPTDWWVMAELCQPGWLREATKKKLSYRLGIHEDMGDYFRLVEWHKPEVKKLYRRLKPITIIQLAKDCLDLPPIVFKKQYFPVSAETKRATQFIKDTSPRAITALIRLRQYSDGFQPTKVCAACEGDGMVNFPVSRQFGPHDMHSVIDYQTVSDSVPGKEFEQRFCPVCRGAGYLGGQRITTPKDEALLEYLHEDRDRIVIYAGFHDSIDKIVEMAKEADWKVIQVDGRGTNIHPPLQGTNPQEIFAEAPGKIAYIGHPTAGGVSITLNRSEIIVFYSNDFNGASRMQAIKRIHRIGTNKAVIVDFLWLPADRIVLANLERKRDLQAITMGELEPNQQY